MRYTVRKSIVQVIGRIWMPAVTCAQTYTLDSSALENIKERGDGKVTRAAVEDWLMVNSGDFQSIEDWSASLEVGDATLEFPWAKGEESEMTFCDCMYPAETDEDCA